MRKCQKREIPESSTFQQQADTYTDTYTMRRYVPRDTYMHNNSSIWTDITSNELPRKEAMTLKTTFQRWTKRPCVQIGYYCIWDAGIHIETILYCTLTHLDLFTDCLISEPYLSTCEVWQRERLTLQKWDRSWLWCFDPNPKRGCKRHDAAPVWAWLSLPFNSLSRQRSDIYKKQMRLADATRQRHVCVLDALKRKHAITFAHCWTTWQIELSCYLVFMRENGQQLTLGISRREVANVSCIRSWEKGQIGRKRVKETVGRSENRQQKQESEQSQEGRRNK